MLRLIHGMVQGMAERQGIPPREVRFTRRDVREATHWSDGQLKIHCTRLADMEYLLTHGGSRGHHLQYELMYDGENNERDDAKRLCGLIDPAELDKNIDYDSRKSGGNERKSAPSQAQVTPKSGPSQAGKTQVARGVEADLPEIAPKSRIQGNGKTAPFVAVVAAVAQ
jgi:CO/xanthine dehydrogenase Mo-binding subunit